MSQSEYLKELLKIGSKDRKRMYLLIIFAVVCGVGIGSSYLMGPDNALEESAENLAEDLVAIELHLPPEDIEGHIDFSPSTPEKRSSYINND